MKKAREAFMLGYTQVGNGTTKVLVFHGWFGDYSVWEPTFKAMDTEQFSYVFIDYRGYGKSSELSGDYTCLLYTSPSPRDS